ncbi:MAG: polysaccharide deacetylase family protein [Bacteroidota bacterium]
MFRHTIPSFIYPVFPSLTWRVKTTERKVYLTFDDGPHPHITPWVLEQLNTFGAKATFFCVGNNVQKFPDVYASILDAGHAVGNHTFHHVRGWNMSTADYVKEVEACAQLVNSPLFRPPYGRIHLNQIRALKSKYSIVMWSILARDYDPNLNVAATLRFINRSLLPGSIIVMHDSQKAEKNLNAMLPEILRAGRENGFTFDALNP